MSGSPAAIENPSAEGLYDVVLDGEDLLLHDNGGSPFEVSPDQHRVYLITINVRVLRPGRFAEEEAWEGFSPSPNPDKRNSLSAYFTENPVSRGERLTVPFAMRSTDGMTGARVAEWLLGGSVVTDFSSGISSRPSSASSHTCSSAVLSSKPTIK